MTSKWWLVPVIALAMAVGCDNDPDPEDAGPMDSGTETDGGTDSGVPMALELDGLDGEVEVIIDDRGVPHIYATTRHDLLMVEGYMMSRDRFAQMEFIRRNVLGRLSEALFGASPSVLDDDRDQRFLGFGRTGRAIYDSLPADDPTRLMADAFVEGINAYIDDVVLADDYVPPRGLETFSIVRNNANFGHWDPADVFAMARFQSFSLSYDAGADIGRSAALEGIRTAFDPTDTNEALAARAGYYADGWSEVQARRVYTRDGFNDGTTDAFLPPTLPHRPAAFDFRPSVEALTGARRFFDRINGNWLLREDEHVGSNSWAVSGDATASGNAILSNDPHLSLISPGVWWYVHLNTARMGGEDNIDAQGVAFATLPGVVLGFNQDIAWSATTTGYDVTDVYDETVTFRNDGTPEAPEWTPVSVLFDGGQVNLETIEETIVILSRDDEVMTLYDVPHHGPIIPDSIVVPDVTDPAAGSTAEGSAMSVRYTGHVPTNELAFFNGLLTASTLDDAFAAQDNFRVGAQNFSFATRTGDIGWSTQSWIPQREAGALTWTVEDDGTITGVSPLLVLPGDGTAEWTDPLADEFIPHDRNPSRGYIATANQDNVGVTDDNNPCNDDHYIGGDFAWGWRQGRITDRLDALVADGEITTDDMIALQAETRSSLGESSAAALIASLDHAIGDTSDDPALAAYVTSIGGDGVADLTAVRDRLMAWTSFATPHAIGSTDSAVIADSVATTLFNATLTRLTGLAFSDEATLIGRGPSSGDSMRLLEWSLMDGTDQAALPLHTYREDYLGVTGWNDTVLWDDVSTEGVIETRDERVAQAVVAAVAFLETELGDDWDEWRWGRLHAVRFGQVVPPLSGAEQASIPPSDSTEFPLGFPRAGDYGAVDVGNFSAYNGTRFTHGSGASQRLVVEMTESGPLAYNALPGGQSEDPDNPHHSDEAELWRQNQQPPLYFQQADVEEHEESRMMFAPAN
ncbi:MAG: penicillin acylase family protein [Sandaracinaceae bacterium]